MKNILFVAYLTFGPGMAADPHTLIYSVDMGTERACRDEVARLQSSGFGHGRIGNLPGYRYSDAAWCEDRDEPWHGSSVQPGPFYPRSQDERDRWTPITWDFKYHRAKAARRKILDKEQN